MPEQQVKTTRSFCRVCTSVCGILVETVGEQVVRVRFRFCLTDHETASTIVAPRFTGASRSARCPAHDDRAWRNQATSSEVLLCKDRPYEVGAGSAAT
jgi:hypothetical protein